MSWRKWFVLIALASALARTVPAGAQATAPAASSADSVHVYLVTIGPGEEVWEKFGHNMIWIHDPHARAGGVDAAYNWGLFNFEDHFIVNFLANHMRYWMDAFPAGFVIQDYIAADRSTWVQELNLTDMQKDDLIDRLEFNRKPENKYYNYDYYRDNCSTRVRDALDAVIGGAIRRTLEPTPTATTYRWHTRRLLADVYFSDLGVQFLLGPWADQKINQWQEAFLPVKLMEHVRHVQTIHGPLVLSERTLHTSHTYVERDAPPGRLIPYAIIGILLGAAGVGVGTLKNKWLRAAATTVTFAWAVVGLLGGTLLLILWLFTTHVPPMRNHNELVLNPLFILMVIALPLLRRPRLCRLARDVSLAIAVLSVIALILKPLPWSHQMNGDILALAVTANLGMAAGVYLRCRRQREQMEPQMPRKMEPQMNADERG